MNKDKLLELYPDFDKVLGPYLRPDGRQHVVLYKTGLDSHNKEKRKTISYPKALVESETGRRLKNNETVDHIDRDMTNNGLSNLQVLDRSTHGALDVIRVTVYEMICDICGKSFMPKPYQLYRFKDKSGPFCSTECSRTYRKRVQLTQETLPSNPIIRTYYRWEK